MELYPYQERAMPRLLEVLKSEKQLDLCAASTGFGKTFMALELIRRSNSSFAVLCPKVTLGQWRNSASIVPRPISTPSGSSDCRRAAGARSPLRNERNSMELYDYQKPLITPMLNILNDPEKLLALLALSTGTGKTVVALELMRRANFCSFGVLAPKVTLGQWLRTAKEIGVSPKFVLNPEAVRNGNRPDVVVRNSPVSFSWKALSDGDVLVLDEIHRFGAPDSQLAYMAAHASAARIKILGLSASLADSPLKLRMLLHAARIVPWNRFYQWAASVGCHRAENISGHPWRPPMGKLGVQVMADLNARFFPAFGVRLDAKDILSYPRSQTIVDLVTPSEKAAAEARAAYALLAEEIRNPLKAKTEMVQLLRFRQQVEHAKVPVMVELAEDAIEDGMSVAVFWNFTAPMAEFCKRMAAHSPARVYGTDASGRVQTQTERDAEIERFQSNQTRLFAGTISAGGVGLSLEDSDGNHPRLLLANLPLSSQELVQVIGRCARANSKSPTLNRVVLLEGVPIEEHIYRLLSRKINNLSSLMGDDLDLDKLLRDET